MGLVIFKRCNNIDEALITVSALEAGGFHPSYQNYNHAHIAYLQMIAFEGLIVQIPSQEFIDARQWLAHIQSKPITDYDPLPKRKYGMWKTGTLLGLTAGPGWILPVFFLPPLWLVFIFLGLAFFEENKFIGLIGLFFPLLLCHAHYIAVPKLKKRSKNVD